MIKVKFKKIDAKAVLPIYAKPGDAGLDLCSIEQKRLYPGERVLIRTGLAVELPGGTEAEIRPRSGLALDYGITVLNSPGTIDEGYRGEIGVILINHSRKMFEVKEGMRVAQMVVRPVLRVEIEECTELSETERGAGGFGSTGKEALG